MSSSHLSSAWFRLPSESHRYVFSFLSFRDICACSCTSKALQSASNNEEVWFYQCQKHGFLDYANDEELFALKATDLNTLLSKHKHLQSGKVDDLRKSSLPKFKYLFTLWFVKFKRCPRMATEMYKLYKDLTRWLQQHKDCHVRLMPGATLAELEESEQHISLLLKTEFKWPNDLYCWFLLTNGQHMDYAGLFGSYSFYDHEVDLKLMSLTDIIDTVHTMTSQNLFPGNVPLIVSEGQKMIFLVANPNMPHLSRFKKSNLITLTGGAYSGIADSYRAYLKNHIKNILSGNYIVRLNHISLYPNLDIPTAVTNNVKITASPLFIPERATGGTPYFWAYFITISMDKDVEEKTFDCKLESRHWDITSGGRTEVVDGPGVIGEYPEISPGVVFTYASCCPLRHRTGTMGGYFRMRKQHGDRSYFDAVVPTFKFEVPTMLKDEDELE